MAFFTGSYKYSVDVKGRVNIPARYRSQIEEDSEGQFFYVARGPNINLSVFPPEVFENMIEGLERECGSYLEPNDNRRKYLNTMATAQSCRCDKQGRLIVPKEHLEYAKINGEVKIVGLRNRIELWNPDLFDQYVNEQSSSELS